MAIDEDGWQTFRIDWWEVPGRDEKWKNKQLESLNQQEFNQEFGNQFLGSSYTLLAADCLKKYKVALVEKGKDFYDKIQFDLLNDIKDLEICIYEKPNPEKCYVIGADVADGVGGDASTLDIWDITDIRDLKQVASASSQYIGTSEFAYLISKLYITYFNPPVFIEANNMGRSTIEFLYQIYENEDIATIGGKNLGILSNNKIKTLACLNFKRILENSTTKAEINNIKLIYELEYFEKTKSIVTNVDSYRAVDGKHDDRVLASIWALFVLDRENLEYYYDCDWVTAGSFMLPINIKRFKSINEVVQNKISLDKRYDEMFSSQHSEALKRLSANNMLLEPRNNYNNYQKQDLDVNNIGFMN